VVVVAGRVVVVVEGGAGEAVTGAGWLRSVLQVARVYGVSA